MLAFPGVDDPWVGITETKGLEKEKMEDMKKRDSGGVENGGEGGER